MTIRKTKSRRAGKGKPFRCVTVGNMSVSIYRLRRGKFTSYQVADYSAGKGRRKLKWFADLKKAIKEAERVAALIASGEASTAGLGAKERAAYGLAIERLRETDVPIEVAAAHYSQAHRLLGGDLIVQAAEFFAKHRIDKLPTKTVAEVVDELLVTKQARGKSARYIGDLRQRLARFAESFQVGIATITTADVAHWLDGLKGAPQTVKNYRRVVGTLFGFAESHGYIFKNSNPVEGTEPIETNGDGDIEIFTPAELARLLGAASPEYLPCLAVGAFAGLRSAELQRLDWREVDLAGGFIEVKATKAKTATRRLVPVSANLAVWLAPYAKKQGQLWTGANREFCLAQKTTAAATRIDANPAKGIVGQDPVKWKPNALRHSFISYRLAQVQSAAQVALEAGNSPQMVIRHYRELVKPADAVKWFAIRPEQPANVVPRRSSLVSAANRFPAASGLANSRGKR